MTKGKSLKLACARLVLAALALSGATNLFAGPGAVDTTFNVVVNNTVDALLPLSGGKILVGGAFTTIAGVQRGGLARLFPDGTLDTTFSNSISSQGTVFAILMQPDGKLLIGGSFTTASGSRQNVARLNADGSIDGSFTNSFPSSSVFALGLQTNGQVLIGGQFTSVGGSNHFYIARLNSDGTVDNTFNAGTISGSSVNDIAVQADGNILIGGSFGSFSTFSLTRNNIARLTANGTPDLSYQPTTTASVQSVFLEPDGQSVWGGSFSSLDLNTRQHVGMLNTDGSLDSGFIAPIGANNTVNSVTEDANGNIYVGGLFSEYNNTIREGVARLFSDGTLDTSFNSTTNFTTPQVRCVAIQNDGRVLVGGTFISFNSIFRTNLVRLYGDNYPAEIITQPQPRNVAVGTNVTFSVEVSNPTAVNYQWRLNGVNIPGATFNEYSLFNVQMADAGTYSVEASTGLGGTTSSNALLQVGIAPVITQPPTNITVAQGQTATFSATATGTSVAYNWLLGKVVIGTNSTLTFSNVTPAQAGPYSLIVSNFVGSVTNPPVTLTVQFPVTLVSSPSSQSILAGGAANFAVSATGNPLNYQWLKGSNTITNANGPQYSISNAALTDAGAYSVIVSNQFNSLTSSVANLIVGVPPQNLLSHLNSNKSLTIQMPGTPGFNYVLQTTTSLTPPVLWRSIATNTTDTNGNWTYADTNTSSSALFYRVSSP